MAVVFAALRLWLALLVAGFIALLVAAVTGGCVFTLAGVSFRGVGGLVTGGGSSLAGSMMSGRFAGSCGSSGVVLPGCGLFGNSCVVTGAGRSGSCRSAIAAGLLFSGSVSAGGFESTDFGNALCERDFEGFDRF